LIIWYFILQFETTYSMMQKLSMTTQ